LQNCPNNPNNNIVLSKVIMNGVDGHRGMKLACVGVEASSTASAVAFLIPPNISLQYLSRSNSLWRNLVSSASILGDAESTEKEVAMTSESFHRVRL
jgi:hypothetical protein